jgi:hypothetical protein
MTTSLLRAARRVGRIGAAALALGALLVPGAGRATKPCAPDTWFADPGRPAAAYGAAASWVAIGVVVRRVERKVPAPNCALPDPTRCARSDRSSVTIRVERYERGAGPAELVLTAAPCAPDPPTAVGGRYRLYGSGADQYAMFEPLPTKP